MTNINLPKTKALLGYHAWKGDTVFVTEIFKGKEYNALKIVTNGPYGDFVDSLSIKRLLGDPEYTDVKVLFKKYLTKVLSERKVKAIEEVIWAIIGNKNIDTEEDGYVFLETENKKLYGDRTEQAITARAEEAKASLFSFLQEKLGAEYIDNMLWSLTCIGNSDGCVPERPGTVHDREYEPEAWVVDSKTEAEYIRREARRTYKWIGWRLNEIVALGHILQDVSGLDIATAKDIFKGDKPQQSYACYGNDSNAAAVIDALRSVEYRTEEAESLIKAFEDATQDELERVEEEYQRFHKRDKFSPVEHPQITKALLRREIKLFSEFSFVNYDEVFRLAIKRGIPEEEARAEICKFINSCVPEEEGCRRSAAIKRIITHDWASDLLKATLDRIEKRDRHDAMKKEIAEALAYGPTLDVDFDEEFDF